MHATEWIEQHGRYLRKINARTLRKTLGREKGQCTWCGGQLPKGRTSWCSDDCVDEFLVRCACRVSYKLEQRDHGICAVCGLDTLALKRRVMSLRSRSLGHTTKSSKKRPYSWQRVCRLMKQHNLPYQPFECDHIVPVVEGGGLCGLDNYRTLCIPCHRAETKRLAGRLAAVRRDAGRQLLEPTE